MFISNTATALMLLPIGLALVYKIEEAFPNENTGKFSSAIMLSIAYGASVGGIATLIGTPPNLVFRQILKITFPTAPSVNFGNWMIMALPITILMIIFVWILLSKVLFRVKGSFKFAGNIIEEEYKALGKTTYQEKVVFIVFVITCFLWIFRKKMELGALVIPGWSDGLPFTAFIDDGTIAIAAALSLFLIPSKSDSQAAILDNSVFRKLPWDIILLFGGGFALAEGFQKTGLSDAIGNQFSVFSGVHPLVFVVIICTFVTFLTELTSNTATTQIILPILASLGVSLHINPILFMIPATISASFAFMLPVGTPPNAVAFSSGRIRIGQMARTGFLINLAGILVVSIFFYYAGTYIFSIDPSIFPQWGMVGK
jgi:sodium-dependent dicarboxylate transporter 2/3/5